MRNIVLALIERFNSGEITLDELIDLAVDEYHIDFQDLEIMLKQKE